MCVCVVRENKEFWEAEVGVQGESCSFFLGGGGACYSRVFFFRWTLGCGISLTGTYSSEREIRSRVGSPEEALGCVGRIIQCN